MLRLQVAKEDNSFAVITVYKDDDPEVQLDVCVDIKDGKVTLIVTDDIVARDSDEPTMLIPLLTSLSAEEKVSAP